MKKTTKVININEESIEDKSLELAAESLRRGGLVAFPTETVYGLGANALDEKAVGSIFKAKGRPSDNPLIVHISSRDQLCELVSEIPKEAEEIMEKFWPGPLTLIFKKTDKVPFITSGGLETVAIRMPDNRIALKLIEKSGLALAAPSANTSGRPSPTRAQHVLEDLDGKIDLLIDGGKTGVGLESTVLDLTGDFPTILRPGGVTHEDLLKTLPRVEYDLALETDKADMVPKSPGQKYRHYSPRAKMEIFSGHLEEVIDEINAKINIYTESGIKVGVMASDETIDKYNTKNLISMGSRKDLQTIALNVFHVLREFDKLDVDLILSEGVEETGIGKAIMNRMKKAAGGNIRYLE